MQERGSFSSTSSFSSGEAKSSFCGLDRATQRLFQRRHSKRDPRGARLRLLCLCISPQAAYVVGDRGVWMINVKESEPNPCASRNQALAFAMGAAQKLGMRGERA